MNARKGIRFELYPRERIIQFLQAAIQEYGRRPTTEELEEYLTRNEGPSLGTVRKKLGGLAAGLAQAENMMT